jgi:hypothetical protein
VKLKSYHIVLSVLVVCTAFAQQAAAQQITDTFNRCFYNPPMIMAPKINYDSVWAFAKNKGNVQSRIITHAASFTKVAGISPAGSMASWGVFCHAEHRFRQSTRLPLYLRLGSVEMVNRLEGK